MFYPNHVRFVLWQLLPFCCWQLSRCLVLIFFVILVFSLLLIQHLGNQLSWSYVWTSWRLSCERQMSWTCSDRLSLGKSMKVHLKVLLFFGVNLDNINWLPATEVGHRIYYSLGPEFFTNCRMGGWKVWWKNMWTPIMETLVGPSWLLQVAAMLAFDVSYHELQLHV